MICKTCCRTCIHNHGIEEACVVDQDGAGLRWPCREECGDCGECEDECREYEVKC